MGEIEKQVNKHHTFWKAKIDLTWARFLSPARTKLRLCSANHRSGYFMLGVSSDYAQPIKGQASPVIGLAQPELTSNKRQKMGAGLE